MFLKIIQTISNYGFINNSQCKNLFSFFSLFFFFEKSFFLDIYMFFLFIFNNYFFSLNNNLMHFFCTAILDFENFYFCTLNLNFFWTFILFVGLFFSLNIIYAKNALNSLLFLIFLYIYSSILLILFNLEFFGLLYIIIYVGAIAVLFLFIIMMLKFEKNFFIKKNFFNKLYNLYIYMFFIFFYFYNYNYNWFFIIKFNNANNNLNMNYLDNVIITKLLKLNGWTDDLFDLSNIFYTNYNYIFILLGLILLLSIVAPIILTFRERLNVKHQKSFLQINKNKFSTIYLKNF